MTDFPKNPLNRHRTEQDSTNSQNKNIVLRIVILTKFIVAVVILFVVVTVASLSRNPLQARSSPDSAGARGTSCCSCSLLGQSKVQGVEDQVWGLEF